MTGSYLESNRGAVYLLQPFVAKKISISRTIMVAVTLLGELSKSLTELLNEVTSPLSQDEEDQNWNDLNPAGHEFF